MKKGLGVKWIFKIPTFTKAEVFCEIVLFSANFLHSIGSTFITYVHLQGYKYRQ